MSASERINKAVHDPAAGWKVATVILTFCLIGLSWIIWNEREFLMRKTFEKPTNIGLNVPSFINRSASTLPRHKADVSILWKVDLTKNTRESLVYLTPTGRITDREHKLAPIWSKINEENEFAVHLINNETFCGNLITRSKIGLALLADNVIYLCRSPVISSEGLLIGYVTFGFKQRPTADEQEESIRALRDLAREVPTVDYQSVD